MIFLEKKFWRGTFVILITDWIDVGINKVQGEFVHEKSF